MGSRNENEALDQIHVQIGKLVVAYEWLIELTRDLCADVFERNGMKRPELAHAALVGRPAGRLVEFLSSLVKESGDLSESQKQLFSDFISRSKAVIEERNTIIHGLWNRIDASSSPAGPPEGIVTRTRRRSGGLVRDFYQISSTDVEETTNEIQQLHGVAGRLRKVLTV